jgi:hypothetical protein
VSGPVDSADVAEGEPSPVLSSVVEVSDSRIAQVGSLTVRRALPHRGRRTVGPWCFADHFGPTQVSDRVRPDIGPHPHMGLQTVTWLLAGELVHHDSLGSEQPIRPGQLNLMTAGFGVAHAEEATGYVGPIHGVQLWVAQPSATRDGRPAFEHHPELPELDLDNVHATLLVGELAGLASPARRDSDLVGADLVLRAGAVTVPLDSGFEHALLVTSGSVRVDGVTGEPGHLLYLGTAREELRLVTAEPSRALLLGGEPFPEQLLMWWNFVARTRDEIDAAYDAWARDTGRFGVVSSHLARIDTQPPWWQPSRG